MYNKNLSWNFSCFPGKLERVFVGSFPSPLPVSLPHPQLFPWETSLSRGRNWNSGSDAWLCEAVSSVRGSISCFFAWDFRFWAFLSIGMSVCYIRKVNCWCFQGIFFTAWSIFFFQREKKYIILHIYTYMYIYVFLKNQIGNSRTDSDADLCRKCDRRGGNMIELGSGGRGWSRDFFASKNVYHELQNLRMNVCLALHLCCLCKQV